MKRNILLKNGYILLSILLCSLLLTGCGDLVEIQDRDFVLALGISYDSGQYQVTYSLPDLAATTEQIKPTDKDSQLRTYRGTSLREIDQSYNFNSEKRLDYRHLQVIILDSSICSRQQVMKDLLVQINDYYDISHNVLIYFYEADVRQLMGTEGVNGSIGEHLKKLNNNNSISGLDPAKIGTLIDCMENERTLFIPALHNRDNSIAVDGGIFFRENQMLLPVAQIDSEIYYITLGKSNDYLMRLSPSRLFQIKEIKTKTSFELTSEGPVISLKVTGSAKSLPGTSSENSSGSVEETNAYIKEKIEMQIAGFMKRDHIDYLNLYEKSSYQSRQTWLRYKDRLTDFINEASISVTVDINCES
ncbi:MAG: hypothetical protein ACRDBO_08655 [Lachnospiraceae bacterium]